MAVKFNDDNFTISIPTGMNPAEDWLETHKELVDVLQCSDPELSGGNHHGKVLEVLKHMMPDLDTVKKMTMKLIVLFFTFDFTYNY